MEMLCYRRRLRLCLQAKRRSFQCSVCQKQFVSRTGLRSHEDAHRGVYKYTCPVCSKGFHSHSHMRGHLAVHTHVREFSCPYCGKQYAYSGDLSRHVSRCTAAMLPDNAALPPPLPPPQLDLRNIQNVAAVTTDATSGSMQLVEQPAAE